MAPGATLGMADLFVTCTPAWPGVDRVAGVLAGSERHDLTTLHRTIFDRNASTGASTRGMHQQERCFYLHKHSSIHTKTTLLFKNVSQLRIVTSPDVSWLSHIFSCNFAAVGLFSLRCQLLSNPRTKRIKRGHLDILFTALTF